MKLDTMKKRSKKTIIEIAFLLAANIAACLFIAPASCLLTGFTVGWFAQWLQIDAWLTSGKGIYLFVAICLGSSIAFAVFVGLLSAFNWVACKSWTTGKQCAVMWTKRFAYAPTFAVCSGVAYFLHRFFM